MGGRGAEEEVKWCTVLTDIDVNHIGTLMSDEGMHHMLVPRFH
jgi:hypothetical protein